MEELGKSLPLAEGIVDAEQAGKDGGNKECLNCGTLLTGKYCSTCGQRDLPARQDLGDLLINFISSFYSFESKFFKTFQYLLFKPWRIINDYNQGKRESFYHPARMYVFLSFIFFLLISIFNSTDDLDIGNDSKKVNSDSLKTAIDSVIVNTGDWGGFNPLKDSNKLGINLGDSIRAELEAEEKEERKKKKEWKNPYYYEKDNADTVDIKTVAQYDSIQATLPEDKRDNFIERYFERKKVEIEAKGKDKEEEMTKQFIDDAIANIPRMLFFLMPIMALLLKLLYVRRDYYYSEHLIFTVFFYDFVYLTASLAVLAQQVSWLSWLQGFIYLWMFVYLYKCMRHVYKQGRAKTVTKFFLFISMFFFCAMIGFVAIFLIAFANL